MEEDFLDEFFIEEIEERDPISNIDKIYFNPDSGGMYLEGWHSSSKN